jgi:hypothetical protein
MIGWGWVIGVMAGATYGAAGGGLAGLAAFCLDGVRDRPPAPPERTLVVLLAAGSMTGAVVGSVSGSVLGPVVAGLASHASLRAASWWAIAVSALLFASSGVAAGLLVGAMLPMPARVVAALIGGATGLLGGIGGGRFLAKVAQLTDTFDPPGEDRAPPQAG